jgi:hypothetical protein
MKKLLLVLLSAFAFLLASPGAAEAVSAHEVVSNPIVCTLNADQTVTCSGSVAGLGNQAVVVTLDVDFACATRGNENRPGGHLQSVSAPIQPRNGRINFSETTGPADCPPGLNPVVGDTATVTILNLAERVLFTKEVEIT